MEITQIGKNDETLLPAIEMIPAMADKWADYDVEYSENESSTVCFFIAISCLIGCDKNSAEIDI